MASHALDEAHAQVASAQQQIAAVVASLGGNPDIAPDRHPSVQQAQAALDRARLDLSYTTITAPGDGVVTRVEQLQVGSYVKAADPLFALVSTGDVWIEANFKEDQLAHMRVGQPAEVRVDSYPDHALAGKVASLSPGTGSQFSALPPENATGNWVKVVQRLPVRIALDPHDRGRRAARGPERRRARRHRLPAPRVRPRDGRRRRRHRAGAMSAAVAQGQGADAPHRGLITMSVMLASIMQALDNTIANVALPRIQGSLSATQDQMTWVLTSYIVAAAIMTPLSGWLAGQVGRKRVFLFSIVGFTVASALCGLAQSLPQIVAARLVQGLCGAALIPMSQAVLLDINPPAQHARAMAIWVMGVTLGPILGPALGGWLTENYNWRWVFYINVPFGILAFLGISLFMTGNAHPPLGASTSSASRRSASASARCS